MICSSVERPAVTSTALTTSYLSRSETELFRWPVYSRYWVIYKFKGHASL